MALEIMTKKIDQVAKLIKEMHGLNNPERRTISIDTGKQKNVRRYRTFKRD